MERAKTTLTDGSPVTADHREINPQTGMQKAYVVLSADERAKGFVEPVRRSYVHAKCGGLTTMGQSLAETYARQPEFYSGTFCAHCRNHFPVGPDGEFVWTGTDQKVGTRSVVSDEDCPGHVASDGDNKVCAICGIHINELRPDDSPEAA